jgi:hypothetical protein
MFVIVVKNANDGGTTLKVMTKGRGISFSRNYKHLSILFNGKKFWTEISPNKLVIKHIPKSHVI